MGHDHSTANEDKRVVDHSLSKEHILQPQGSTSMSVSGSRGGHSNGHIQASTQVIQHNPQQRGDLLMTESPLGWCENKQTSNEPVRMDAL